jgi:c-di-GMP-binding flagellar brake protein YcgR
VNEIVMLNQISPPGILQEIMLENIPLFMSSFCSGRWQVNRVLVLDARADSFDIKVSPRKKNQQVQLSVEQSVGISFQHEYGQGTFIFNTRVVALKSSTLEDNQNEILVLSMPQQMELVQKQNFKRVQAPVSMDVQVALWHKNIPQGKVSDNGIQVLQGFRGKLIDISAGGLQVAVNRSQGPAFEKNQFVHLEFIPSANETPLKFNAYVRQIFPDAHQDYILLGFEMMGLEASAEGRMVLQRICSVVKEYRQINESAKP